MLGGLRMIFEETEVAVVRLPHRPGELGRAAARLGENKINIDYSYCGLEPGSAQALLVFFGGSQNTIKASASSTGWASQCKWKPRRGQEQLVNGLMYTGSAHQLWEQFRAAVWVIFWSALVTFILMQLIKLVLRGARYKDEILEVGDLAIHGEEAFPEETFAMRTGEAFAMAGVERGSEEPPIGSDPSPPPDERS